MRDKLSCLICKEIGMKLLVRTIVVSLLILFAYVLIGLARNSTGQIEFNGHRYPSIDAARQAAGRLIGVRDNLQPETGEGVALFCGQRLTLLALTLGFYGPYDPMVCFASEAESDQLYAENRELEARYKQFSKGILPPVAFVSSAFISVFVLRKLRKTKR